MRFDPSSSPFVVRDALASGATPGELRGSSLVMPTRGARVGAARAAIDPRGALLEALRPLARDDQFFSHTTAARLHGMPLPGRLLDDPVHLASPSLTNRVRRRGVVGHRVKASVVEVDGYRVESIPDAFVHLGASILSVDELVEVGDWIVHRDRAVRLTPADLLAHAREFRGARGMRSVLAAIPQLRAGADSPGETRTRLLLRRAGLPEPVLQHRVRDGRARLVATLDMAYPDLHVGIEYEGAHHHLDAGQFAYDIRRYAALDAHGWRIVRVTHADIRDRGARVIPLVRAARRDSGHSMP
ncbi:MULTISPECIES: endonuclease domain-containing protein [unclassified Agrococcus]|uniref:endonuclease domain-containing protein n=1 Tax=unclassified Agrococcus TaxID=2615065 RepID=UPI00361BCF81